MRVGARDVKENGLIKGRDKPVGEKMSQILLHNVSRAVVAARVTAQQLTYTIVSDSDGLAPELLAHEGVPGRVLHIVSAQTTDERQVVQGRETKAQA